MAAAAVAGPNAPLDLTAVRNKLNKKSSFEDAAQQGIRAVTRDPALAASPEFRTLLRRAFTVLRTRCGATDVALWAAGRELARAARGAVGADAAFLQEVAVMEAQCDQVLGEQPESDIERPLPHRAAAGLFEGQLSTTQVGDGPLAADPWAEYTARLFAMPPGGEDAAGPVPPATASLAEAEELQRRLDAAAVRIIEETAGDAPRPAPPASRAAVLRLPRETVTAARWEALGGADARCPVCFCLDPGDELVTLPCGHWAHPTCVAPWLRESNSCPTCRHELPTDDEEYERRKRREAAAAEERRGAANALSHSEFLYI